jgi:hypothetical protein
MRLGLLVIALAACSSAAVTRPAWPKATAHEVDGGESLAPRAAARAIAAIVEEDDKPVDKVAADKHAPAAASGSTAAGATDRPAAAAPAAAAPEEPITGEDIVIEIED